MQDVRYGSLATLASRSEMSALPPKADMFSVEIDVRFVPEADLQLSVGKIYSLVRARRCRAGGEPIEAIHHRALCPCVHLVVRTDRLGQADVIRLNPLTSEASSVALCLSTTIPTGVTPSSSYAANTFNDGHPMASCFAAKSLTVSITSWR